MSELRLKTAALAVSAIFCVATLSACGGKNDTVNGTITVGGKVSGMDTGTTIVLSDNGFDNLAVTANGDFTFATKLIDLTGYRVAVVSNPVKQICSLSGPTTGILASVAITNIAVTCNPSSIIVSTIAGTLGVAGSADGKGTAASFNGPTDIAVDSAGNAYVAERLNNTIRKIDRDGIVSTFAGTAGLVGFVNNDKDTPATTARFNAPTGVAIDAAGNVYVADSGNNAIRKITPAGLVTTFAGTGVAGSDEGKGTSASFSSPARLALDTAGNVYVTDRGNSTIRKITPSGIVSTLAGKAGSFESVDGTGSDAHFFLPIGIAVDASGNVYVGDGADTIRKITSDGNVSTLAGTHDAPGATDNIVGTAASFNNIGGLAVDSAGNVYVADQGNSLIRKVSPSGVVSIYSGIWGRADSVDGTAGAGGFRIPTGIAIDSTGNLFVTDYPSATIRKIAPH